MIIKLPNAKVVTFKYEQIILCTVMTVIYVPHHLTFRCDVTDKTSSCVKTVCVLVPMFPKNLKRDH